MERGEHHVASVGGAEGLLRRLFVANLAHQDDVGVLPEECPDGAGKGDLAEKLLRFDPDLHGGEVMAARLAGHENL